MAFFAYAMHKTLALIAVEDRLFPIWCSWLMVIPKLGIIFQWLMVPFGLPKSLKAHMPNHEALIAKSDKLFKLGLGIAICSTLMLVLGFLMLIPTVILLVLYWVELSEARKILQSGLAQ